MFADRPVAIVDIGSNSVRLVVYSGADRAPSIIFNEKVLAGLGHRLAETGAIDPAAEKKALRALARFRLLTRQMGAGKARAVATAAVREARNGTAFLKKVAALGFSPETLSGDEEARLAGLGVVSSIPDADGVVGDLGGGSLELVEVSAGTVGQRTSLPLGIFRLDSLGQGRSFASQIAAFVEEAGFTAAARGRPFYLVGGSWRNLTQLDQALISHPLPVIHQHPMEPERAADLARLLDATSNPPLGQGIISSGRRRALPEAARLLAALVDTLKPSLLITSSYGIREGLLFDTLGARARRLDPLIEQAREAGAGLGRFEQHGTLIDNWIAGVCGDAPAAARLRHAACLLSDIAWAAHPDYRAERAVDMALHGNWVAIDAPGRVMLAMALFATLARGNALPYPALASLCSARDLQQARRWGLAIALAQRLSGGVAAGLESSQLSIEGESLVLRVAPQAGALAGESVEKRMRALARELGLTPRIES